MQDSGADSGFGGEASGAGGDFGAGGALGTDGVGGSLVGSGGASGTGSVSGVGGTLGAASGGSANGSGGTGGMTYFGVCPAGQWDSELPWSDGKGCIPWSSAQCLPGQSLEQQGTALLDHVCAACAPGTFSTAVNQMSCLELTQCSLAEEQSAPGSSSSDVTCVPTEPWGFVDRGNLALAVGLVATSGGLWAAGQNDDFGLVLYSIAPGGEREVLLTSPAGVYVEPRSLALLTDDSLVLAGITNPELDGPGENTEVFVRRLTLAGDELWNRTFSGGSASGESEVTASAGPDETVYVAGTTWGNLAGPVSGDSDVFVRKYDGDGEVAWTEQLDLDPSYDGLYGMAAGMDGNVYFTSTRSAGALGSFLTALDGSGDFLWQLESEELGCTTCSALTVSAEGDLYVAGTTDSYDDNEDLVRVVVLTRLSPSGTVQWVSQVAGGGFPAVTAVLVAGQSAFVLGEVRPSEYGAEDALRIDFSTSGQLLDRWVWGGSAAEWVHAAARTPGGDLYIAGGIERWRQDTYGADAFVALWPDP